MGRGRPQLPHEHLLVRRAGRLRVLDGLRPPVAGLRQRQGDLPHQRPPRERPLLQPARPADHRGQEARGEAHRHRSAPVEHRLTGGLLAAGLARQRACPPPGDRPGADRQRPVRPRLRPALGELGGLPAGGAAGPPGHVRELRRRAQAALRGLHAGVRRGRDGDPRGADPGGHGRDRPRRGRGGGAQLARVGGRRARRLADRPLPVLPQRPDRLGRDARRHLAERLGQVGAQAALHAAPPEAVERADLAARVPPGVLRDVVPAAALPARGPGLARRLLQPRLQPGLDQPGRDDLGAGAHPRGPRRSPRRAHPDLERDGLVRRLRPADGPRRRAPRPPQLRDPRRQLDRLPPAGHPRRRRAGRPDGQRYPRDEPGRGLGGERVLDRAVLADRPGRLARHPALVRVAGPAGREDDRRRLLRLDLRALRARAAGSGRRARG